MTAPWPPNVTLEGEHVRLELLAQRHADDLKIAAEDGHLHRLWYTSVPHPDRMSEEIANRLAQRDAGQMLPFAIIDRRTDRAVGMTTYLHIDAANRRVEIGATWYAASAQRSPLNTECKFLMLRHAFEALDCIAVEFRTHVMNLQSRRAIERLGARLDGILRAHMIMTNGTIRDTAAYSITAPEWPSVSAHLTWQMEKPRRD